MPEVSNRELAVMLHKTPPWVTQQAQLGNLPLLPNRKFDLVPTLLARISYLESSKGDSADDKAEKTKQEVRKLQILNDKAEGKLIPVEEMEALIAKSHFLELDLIMRKLIRESPPMLTKLRTVPRIRKFLKALVVDIYQKKWDLIPPDWNVKPLKGKNATNVD